ncbi:MAG: DUF697 domain-containing protein [Gemmatimonadota bacterium]|nr:MAG: DUF697 domain-containing protein [Gemmatimonadota bacterium]
MRGTLRRFAIFISILILVAFAVFLVNQTTQIVALAARISPLFAQALLWSLVAVFTICVLVPIYLFLRLPKRLVPPASDDVPEFDEHLKTLGKRLRANPALKGMPLDSRPDIESALSTLERHSDKLIQGAASQVFVTTAISQNGSLDAFLVLAVNSRLIWKLAHVYYQRPSLRDMIYLYANVASTALIASSLEEIDIAEQLEPVLATGVGSVAAVVPGTSLLLNSLTTGAANAFLTLRVGIVAKSYCSALVLPPRGVLRRSAAVAAAGMLGTVTASGARRVTQGFVRASRRKVGGMVSGVGDRVEDAWDWLARLWRPGGEEPEPDTT